MNEKRQFDPIQLSSRLAAWWPAHIPRTTVLPVIKFVGNSLVPIHGVRPIQHHIMTDWYEIVGARGAGAVVVFGLAVGQLGKRRYIMHVPVRVNADRIAAYRERQPDAVLRHVMVGDLNKYHRVWLREMVDNDNPAPPLSIVVVAPALWPGHCQLEITHGEATIPIARGQVANSRVPNPEEVDPGFDTKFWTDAIGYGQHYIFVHQNHHPDAWIKVRRKLKRRDESLLIGPDLSVSRLEQSQSHAEPSPAQDQSTVSDGSSGV